MRDKYTLTERERERKRERERDLEIILYSNLTKNGYLKYSKEISSSPLVKNKSLGYTQNND
jgi:hypothetical protein